MEKLVVFVLFLALGIVLSCHSESQKSQTKDVSLLVQQYCGNCHHRPDPEILPKTIWEEVVLPRMGYHLGIYPEVGFRQTLFEENEGGEIVEQAGLYPEEPLISNQEWDRIKTYYLSNAPEQLEMPDYPVMSELKDFELKIPNYAMSPPSTTMIHIREEGGFYIGEANKRSLFQFDQRIEMVDQARLQEGPVDMLELRDQLLVQVMGSFSPTDEPSGFMVSLPKDKSKQAQMIASRLQRPVDFSMDNLLGDESPEFVFAEFGKWTGALSVFIMGPNGYKRRDLDSSPGAVKALILDLNEDGQKDILALFAQGNERISVYLGDGEGNFERRNLIDLHPSMGSCFLDTIDWDGDGDLDIIYAAGDNADYTPILKPYHGIYVFENKGDLIFEQSFFYHLNGAYKAIPKDFDQDGDLDFAAISFFPDFEKHERELFVYLQNQGNGKFETQSIPTAHLGRWIVMDAGDYDQDGDDDIILGSLTMEVPKKPELVAEWVKKGIPFVVFENKLKS
jgi:hypothetical protein